MILSSEHGALNLKCECSGCDAVFSGKHLPTFRSQIQRQPFLPKGRKAPTNKQGTIIHKTTIKFLWSKYTLVFSMPMSNYIAFPVIAVFTTSSLCFLVLLFFSKSDSFSNCVYFVLKRHSAFCPPPPPPPSSIIFFFFFLPQSKIF